MNRVTMTWFRKFLAVAINAWILPTSIEAFGPGARETLFGVGLLTTWVGLLLPQPARKIQARVAVMKRMPEAYLPMNPFHEERSLCLSWKILSLEAEHFLSNFQFDAGHQNCCKV